MNNSELEALFDDLDALIFVLFVISLEQEKQHALNPHISGTASIALEKLKELKELSFSKPS